MSEPIGIDLGTGGFVAVNTRGELLEAVNSDESHTVVMGSTPSGTLFLFDPLSYLYKHHLREEQLKGDKEKRRLRIMELGCDIEERFARIEEEICQHR
jgi:hypothetical protein